MAREQTAWFAMIDGRETGPMSRAEFALRMATDVVDENTFVWTEGMEEWLPAAKVRDLAPMFQTRAKAKERQVRPPPPPAAARAKASRGEGAQEEEEIVIDLVPAAPAVAPAPVQVAPPAPAPQHAAPPPEPEEEDPDRTVLEILPLGERVHQEEVAEHIFEPGETAPRASDSTGSFAIDAVQWAYARSKKEAKPDAGKSDALVRAMKATAVRPQTAVRPEKPGAPGMAVSALPRQPVTPAYPTPSAGIRPSVPRQPPSRVPQALVLAGVVVGGLLVGFAIFLLLRLLF